MPRIRVLHAMNVGGEHRQVGDVVDVDADVASYLIDYNRAELVRAAQSEKAVTTPAEKTTRTRKG